MHHPQRPTDSFSKDTFLCLPNLSGYSGKYCLRSSTLIPGGCQNFNREKASVKRFPSPGVDAQGKGGPFDSKLSAMQNTDQELEDIG